jgi:hypothetical protein
LALQSSVTGASVELVAGARLQERRFGSRWRKPRAPGRKPVQGRNLQGQVILDDCLFFFSFFSKMISLYRM